MLGPLDLAHTTDDEILTWTLGVLQQLALVLLRDGRSEARLLSSLASWTTRFSSALRAPTGMRALEQLFRYVLHVAGESPFSTFRGKLIEQVPSLEEHIMTYYEQILREGIAKGREEGRAQSLAGTLRRLLSLKFGEVDATTEARIASARVDELERYLDRFVSAESAAGVVGS